MCILRGFLKTRIFRLQHRPTTTFARNGQNWWVRCGNDAPWDLRRNPYAELSLVPRSLETRTKRGFPHSHSGYGDGTRFGGKANPAKIAGPVGFLHRTEYSNWETILLSQAMEPSNELRPPVLFGNPAGAQVFCRGGPDKSSWPRVSA